MLLWLSSERSSRTSGKSEAPTSEHHAGRRGQPRLIFCSRHLPPRRRPDHHLHRRPCIYRRRGGVERAPDWTYTWRRRRGPGEVSEMNKDVLSRQVHAAILRTALFCLLAGTGFLATVRFLLPGMPGHVLLARITEFLGWGFLMIAAAALFGAWRESSSLEDDFWHLGSRIRPVRKASSREEAINRLYAELRPLMSHAVADPSLEEEVQTKLALLRRLQTEEAEEMEKRLEARLHLKSGEGYRALERAEELLARYEDPASSNASIPKEG
jgi:hypothetical protein